MSEIYLEKMALSYPWKVLFITIWPKWSLIMGGYYPYDEDFEYFLTEPKKDLSDPELSREEVWFLIEDYWQEF